MKTKFLLLCSLIVISVAILTACGGESYTVTFDTNGGQMYTESVEVTFDKYYTLPTPKRSGYEFLGWYYGETKVDIVGNWQIKENVKLVAKWKFSEYSITYKLNGGTLENPITGYDSSSETFVIKAPTKENNIFSYWIDGNGKIYRDDIVIEKGSTGNITLTAVWWDFIGENGVKFAYDNNELSVIGYEGKSTTGFTINDEYYGVPVVAIAESAFEGLGLILKENTTYFRINLPKSIKIIGKNAFKDCNDIKVLLSPDDGGSVIDQNYINLINDWIAQATIEEGNVHLIDVIKMERPAIGRPKSSNIE